MIEHEYFKTTDFSSIFKSTDSESLIICMQNTKIKKKLFQSTVRLIKIVHL